MICYGDRLGLVREGTIRTKSRNQERKITGSVTSGSAGTSGAGNVAEGGMMKQDLGVVVLYYRFLKASIGCVCDHCLDNIPK